MIAAGLLLSVVSAVAINGGYSLQHASASRLPPLRAATAAAVAARALRQPPLARRLPRRHRRLGAVRRRRFGSPRSPSCRPPRRAASACSRSAADGFAPRRAASVSARRSRASSLLGLSLGSHQPSNRGTVGAVVLWLVVVGRRRRARHARAAAGRRLRHGGRDPLRGRRRRHEGGGRRRGEALVRPGAPRLPRPRLRLHAARVPAGRPARDRGARRALDERAADPRGDRSSSASRSPDGFARRGPGRGLRPRPDRRRRAQPAAD